MNSTAGRRKYRSSPPPILFLKSISCVWNLGAARLPPAPHSVFDCDLAWTFSITRLKQTEPEALQAKQSPLLCTLPAVRGGKKWTTKEATLWTLNLPPITWALSKTSLVLTKELQDCSTLALLVTGTQNLEAQRQHCECTQTILCKASRLECKWSKVPPQSPANQYYVLERLPLRGDMPHIVMTKSQANCTLQVVYLTVLIANATSQCSKTPKWSFCDMPQGNYSSWGQGVSGKQVGMTFPSIWG